MTQLLPVDCRILLAGDRVSLCGQVHRVHRVRRLRRAFFCGDHWETMQATEILHELEQDPGLIQTTIPQGAKINVVVPL